MQEKTRYFLIGVFVLSAITIAVIVLIMLGAGEWQEEPLMLETYFDDSVQGLSVGSKVKHRGVEIGDIKEITFVWREYDLSMENGEFYKYGKYVLVKIGLNRDIFPDALQTDIEKILKKMIEDGLRVRLEFLGITGLAYLEADYVDPKQNPQLEINWEPQTFYIPSAQNTLGRLEDSVNDLMVAMDKDLFPILENLNKAAHEIPDAANRLSDTLILLNEFIGQHKSALSEMVDNARSASEDIKELTSSVKRYPAQVIFGGKPSKSRFDK